MAARPRREKMSAVDTAWLRMDRPHNLMMICGVLLLREPARRSRACGASSTSASSCFRRFRQRAVETPGYAVWETDPHFDIDRHVVHVALPGRAPASASCRRSCRG